MNNCKYGLLLSLTALSFMIYSCGRDKDFKTEMENFTGRHIVLPDEIFSDSTDISRVDNKLVVWFDSTECGSCRMGRLYEWEDDPVMQFARAMGDKFDVYIIFSPKKEDVRSLRFTLGSYAVSYSVLLDETGAF